MKDATAKRIASALEKIATSLERSCAMSSESRAKAIRGQWFIADAKPTSFERYAQAMVDGVNPLSRSQAVSEKPVTKAAISKSKRRGRK